jgi:hypothetical protein
MEAITLYILLWGFSALSAASVSIFARPPKSTVMRFLAGLAVKYLYFSDAYIQKSTVKDLICRDGTQNFGADQYGRGPSTGPSCPISAHR